MAMRMICTARDTASAGRFWPWGPLGMGRALCCEAGQHETYGSAKAYADCDVVQCCEALTVPVSHQELAEALDCSVGLLRASLRDPASASFRNAPGGWEVTVRRLLEARADHFTKLAQKLRPKE